jgi:hypothetical protein
VTTEAQAKHPRGRNGNRRLTTAEVATRDRHAIAEHLRRYGQPLVENTAPMPMPPTWFTPELKGIFIATLESAPPDLLRAGDFENLVTLRLAVLSHRRVAREVIDQTSEASPKEREELERRLRFASSAVGRISKTLGLTPPERARIGLPAVKDSDKRDAWTPFPVVIDGDKAA